MALGHALKIILETAHKDLYLQDTCTMSRSLECHITRFAFLLLFPLTSCPWYRRRFAPENYHYFRIRLPIVTQRSAQNLTRWHSSLAVFRSSRPLELFSAECVVTITSGQMEVYFAALALRPAYFALRYAASHSIIRSPYVLSCDYKMSYYFHSC